MYKIVIFNWFLVFSLKNYWTLWDIQSVNQTSIRDVTDEQLFIYYFFVVHTEI
jgi:hypothetical protein